MATASKTVARKTARAGAGRIGASVETAAGKTARTAPAKAGSTRATNGAAGQPTLPARKASARQGVERDRVAEKSEPLADDALRGEASRKARTASKDLVTSPELVQPVATRPDYWDRACADLVRRDRILKKLIPQFGPVHLAARHDPFVTLARSIVGQQVSVKAAQTAWERVKAACPSLAPARFLKLGLAELTACGLSKRKGEYILDLASHFVSGALHVDTWATMDDEAVIAELTQIRGIGRWTAEMFLIFNLMRPDVLPLDDPGLIQAIGVNYFSGEPVTRSEAREVAANWEPYRTVATWYMWRSLDDPGA